VSCGRHLLSADSGVQVALAGLAHRSAGDGALAGGFDGTTTGGTDATGTGISVGSDRASSSRIR
jgi:hypothetical protein